jgi:hypothetical protein
LKLNPVSLRGRGKCLNTAIIRQAILDRRPLGATYDGAPLSFSPHVLGRDKRGVRRVLAFQHGVAARWRCLRLKRLKRLTPAGEDWRSGHGPYRQHACVVRVEVSAW